VSCGSLMEHRDVRPGGGKGVEAIEFGDREGEADGGEDRFVGGGADVFRIDRNAAGYEARLDLGADLQRARRADRCADNAGRVPQQPDLHQTGDLFETKLVGDRLAEQVGALAEHVSGADIGMAGKGDFHRRGEDANPGAVLRIFRR